MDRRDGRAAPDAPTPSAAAGTTDSAAGKVARAWALANGTEGGDRLGAALALVQIIAAETSLMALDATLDAAEAQGSSLRAATDVRALAAQVTKAAVQAQRLVTSPTGLVCRRIGGTDEEER